MRKYQEAEIFLRCPIIFRYRKLSKLHFECKSGWFDLVYTLSAEIEDIAAKLKMSGIPAGELPSVMEIKHQFGTLRYHMLYSTTEIQHLIEATTHDSQTTCEFCGDEGNLKQIYGNYYTICAHCQAKAENLKLKL